MKVRLTIGWTIILSLVAAIGYAQNPAPQGRALSLADALDIARRSSPVYRQVSNDRTPASRDLLSATTALILPSLNVQASHFQRGRGDNQFIGSLILPSPGFSDRSFSVNLNYQLSGTIVAGRGLARANLTAIDQSTAAALTLLETDVRAQYLNVLEARAREDLARQTLTRASENVALARARQSVGQGTLIEVRRNEVTEGQAEVGVLTAVQNSQRQLLLLFQLMGVPAPAEPVVLTDSFPVVPMNFTADQLVQQALNENPTLRAFRARESAAKWQSRAARSQYLPSLSLNVNRSTGVNTQLAADTFPEIATNYRDPWSFNVTVSLPIFDNFNRLQATSLAAANEEDRRQDVRQMELRLRTDVSTAFHTLDQAFRTIEIQRRNREAAAEALALATQRYRVGSGTYIELLDARVGSEDAEASYITAIYSYHRAIAALENAVGRPLR